MNVHIKNKKKYTNQKEWMQVERGIGGRGVNTSRRKLSGR
jgi:hypothetical protein